ncbi:MAG TPA: TetR family transcriptional regulator [Roseomonas sp.]|jgi:AcrR family transcriptional regulator
MQVEVTGATTTPRRGGSQATRAAILSAARRQFAMRGYDRATVRGIAAEAEVDPALIYYYFTSKESLFAAALDLADVTSHVIDELVMGGIERLGERVVRFFLTGSGEENPGEAIATIVRSAMGSDAASGAVREVLCRKLLTKMAEILGTSRPALRASLAATQIMGLTLARAVLHLEPLVTADDEILVQACAPAVQRYLTGPMPWDEPHS